ncbi:pleckstrin homology domain-containing family B member 1 isoform X1 [Onychomys torridus]|uniref:pleckstrin homology domain-containing family B member 1 isoform X1 n=1 Tax=Onychomys torridus TaxID=38674 RepID=UPI00167F7977|nr:pleckstrin homology domain-containing family B member 1 isoform X1 [Onychomys torridus]XP_036043051.1 pleckstrin homology domain-containing family B member 1 isoform X1 [Onychomys torridus]
MALVRGGWLWRQSSILRRWKRNWFALWLDGTLGYYHDETAQDEEDRVLIHFNVRDIKVGQECHDVQPPEGRSRDGLLTVNLREGSRLHLCAETRDDAIAWKTALLEANSTPFSLEWRDSSRLSPLESPVEKGGVSRGSQEGGREASMKTQARKEGHSVSQDSTQNSPVRRRVIVPSLEMVKTEAYSSTQEICIGFLLSVRHLARGQGLEANQGMPSLPSCMQPRRGQI